MAADGGTPTAPVIAVAGRVHLHDRHGDARTDAGAGGRRCALHGLLWASGGDAGVEHSFWFAEASWSAVQLRTFCAAHAS